MAIPLITFCIPVHNAESYLEETLNSIFNQDYANIEIVCVNDHSTDNSARILKKFSARVTVLEAMKFGASAARNLAFENANGDYIVFFDADDLILPNYVSTQLLKVHKQSSVVICKWGRFIQTTENFEEDPNIIKQNMTFYQWVVNYWTFNLHTTPPGRIMIPRMIIEKAGGWNEALSLNDDLDFFSRVFSKSKAILYNDDSIFFYRSGIAGISSRTKGYTYQLSNWKSFEAATCLTASLFPGDVHINRACANMWQQFVYENYPDNPELIAAAVKRIKEYGGSDFYYPAGGASKLLTKIVGWKLTRHLQLLKKNVWGNGIKTC